MGDENQTAELSPADVTREGIVGEVAVQLKKYWHKYAAGQSLPSDDAVFPNMARELINTDSFIPPGARNPINFDTIKKNINTIQKLDITGEFAKKFGDISVLDDIPDREKTEKIAQAVEEGVTAGTGMFTKIMNYIKGFLSWMMSWFDKDHKSLSEHIGMQFAESTSTAVKNNLNVLRLKEPEEYGALLNDERINQIGEQVAAGAIAKATGKPVPDSNLALAERLVNIKPVEGETLSKQQINTMIDKGVESSVDDTFAKGSPAYKAIVDKKVYTEDELENYIKPAFKTVLKEVVEDSKTLKATDEELRKTIAGKLEQQMIEKGKSFLGNPFTGPMDSVKRKAFIDVIRTDIEVDGKKTPTISDENLELLRLGAGVKQSGIQSVLTSGLTTGLGPTAQMNVDEMRQKARESNIQGGEEGAPTPGMPITFNQRAPSTEGISPA